MNSVCNPGIPPNDPTALVPALQQILTALGGSSYVDPCDGVGQRRDMAALSPFLSAIAAAIVSGGGLGGGAAPTVDTDKQQLGLSGTKITLERSTAITLVALATAIGADPAALSALEAALNDSPTFAAALAINSAMRGRKLTSAFGTDLGYLLPL